jgi:hypothetical protein
MDQPTLIEYLKRRDQCLVGPQVREGQVLADYLARARPAYTLEPGPGSGRRCRWSRGRMIRGLDGTAQVGSLILFCLTQIPGEVWSRCIRWRIADQ